MNLNVILDELDKNSLTVYAEISIDETIRKEIDKALDYTLPLWMAGSSNDAAHSRLITEFDAIANIGWFGMRDRQELRMKLLGCIGGGRAVRHKFINSGGGIRKGYARLYEVLRAKYPDVRTTEIALWVKMNSEEVFKELIIGLGYQSDEIKDLLKEYVSFRKSV